MGPHGGMDSALSPLGANFKSRHHLLAQVMKRPD
jgi:hypothetical protein